MNLSAPSAAPARPLVRFENVTLRLADRAAFEHTDWLVETGRHWGVSGPNGSGKSLFAGALTRSVQLLEGEITYYFHDDGNPPEGTPFFRPGEVLSVSPELQRSFARRHAGYHQARWHSFEGDDVPTVSGYLSRESMGFFPRFLQAPEPGDDAGFSERRAAAVELLGIGKLLGRKLHQLSNGETRKLLLARALMQAPKLLVLDDPFGGLDTASREHLRDVLDSILESGEMNIVFLTAREDELPRGITNLLELKDCRIVGRGSGRRVVSERSVVPAGSDDPSPVPVPIPAWNPPPSDGSPLVELKDVRVKYGDVEVLSGINWTVREGEHWALLGDNGAGKSTLLSLILADNPQAYSNDVRLFGRRRGDGDTIWETKANIGSVSPELQMHYRAGGTCLEVVCSGLFEMIGLYRVCSPGEERKALDWMRFLSIEGLAELPFDSVSIGHERLVLFARALVKNPRLLVCDEPCQGLDAFFRDRILGVLDRLCRETPIGLIYVTHHVKEMPAGVDRFLVLEKGRMLGTPGKPGITP